MTEKFINRNRSLVGVDMGEGCKCLNEPSEALDYLIKNCDFLGEVLQRSLQNVINDVRFGRGGNSYSERPYLFKPLKLDVNVIEQFKTAQLELAWIFGKTTIVDQLLDDKQDCTERFVKGETNG